MTTSQKPDEGTGCFAYMAILILFFCCMIAKCTETRAQLRVEHIGVYDSMLFLHPKPNVEYSFYLPKSPLPRVFMIEVDTVLAHMQDFDVFMVVKPRYHFVVDDNVKGIYTGTWSHIDGVKLPGNNKYMQTFSYSKMPDSFCTYKFNGTGISVVGERMPHHGIMEVTIDNREPFIINCYSAEGKEKVILFTMELPPGEHEIKIRPTGLKDNASSDANIVIDGFRIRK